MFWCASLDNSTTMSDRHHIDFCHLTTAVLVVTLLMLQSCAQLMIMLTHILTTP